MGKADIRNPLRYLLMNVGYFVAFSRGLASLLKWINNGSVWFVMLYRK